jgi:phospholipase C
VEAGKNLSDSWSTSAAAPGQYDLWVLGPNGFHRHFKGDTTVLGGALGVAEVRVCYDIANGDVYVDLMNTGKAACTFRVAPLAYRTDGPWEATVAAGGTQTLHWSLKDSGQWYDFAVTTPHDSAYYRRFAGRVETGQHTITDPAMGTV